MPAATKVLAEADSYIAAEEEGNVGTGRVGQVSKKFSGEASVADTMSEYWKVLRTARRNGALAWLSITRSMESLSGRLLSKTRPRNHKPIPDDNWASIHKTKFARNFSYILVLW